MNRGGGDRPRLAILRALGLGDLLAAVPALRALARQFPGHHRLLIAPSGLEPLAEMFGTGPEGDPVIHEVVDHHGLGDLPDGVHEADVAVNLHGSGPESHRALVATRPGRMFAFRTSRFPDGPDWDPGEHERDRWCRLLSHAGIPADPNDFRLDRDAVTGSGTELPGPVLLHPGAASPARRWPPVRWAAVAAELRAGGNRVLVTGSPAERPIAERVARMAGLPSIAVIAGQTGVAQLAELVAGASLLLSGDTGVAHLATAFGVASVTLFGPVAPGLWGPPSYGPHLTIWKGVTGDPHAKSPDPGLLRIEVPEVLDAIHRLKPAGLNLGSPAREVIA